MWGLGHVIKARGGGGGKRHFFSFYICDRAAEDEQVEKKRIKIRPCIPEILHAKVWGLPVITSKTETSNSSNFF